MTVILYIGIERRSDKKKLMTTLEEYYNKFNEDKRLDSRHGRVEFQTSMHYIHKYLDQIAEETGKNRREIRILDIGAGTGRYSIALAEEGYDVTAVENGWYRIVDEDSEENPYEDIPSGYLYPPELFEIVEE